MASPYGRKGNGEGTIYRDSSGRWIAEISWVDQKDGKIKRKRFSAKKHTEVKIKLNNFKKELMLSGSGMQEESSVSFEQFATYWLENIEKIKLKPRSYMRKESTLKYQVFPHIGYLKIDSIEHDDVQKMINDLNSEGLAYSTVKKAYDAVNGCLRYYRIKTKGAFNPCEGVVLPKQKEKPVSDIQFFSSEQIKTIEQEADRKYSTGRNAYKHSAAIIFLMYTGLRVGEAIALTWSDVDLSSTPPTISVNKNAVAVKHDGDNGRASYVMTVQKSAKTESGARIIPLSTKALDALMRMKDIYGAKDDLIISKVSGGILAPDKLDKTLMEMLRHAGIAKDGESYGVHVLRHTFASMLFRNGCDIKTVSELLGHSSTTITENIYIHLIQEQRVKAITNLDNYTD